MKNIKRSNKNGRFIARSANKRFFSMFKKIKSGCWEWQFYKDKDGYGSFSISGNCSEGIRSNRASWILFRGKIPQGMCVLHHCDNPPCVNPDHLFLGTHKDNAIDRTRKSRGSRGERVNTNILKREHVIEIRKSLKNRSELSILFNVSYATICDIINRRSWKWLT